MCIWILEEPPLGVGRNLELPHCEQGMCVKSPHSGGDFGGVSAQCERGTCALSDSEL